MSPEELAWAAGLLEGEGCITVQSPKLNVTVVRIVCVMTDLDVLQKLQRLVPGSKLTGPYSRLNCKDTWMWALYKQTLVKPFLLEIFPWMGQRRKIKIIEGLKLLANSKKARCKRYHPNVERIIYVAPNGTRHCKECARISRKENRLRQKEQNL